MEKHIELAKDVIIGDVIAGEVGNVQKDGYHVQLTFKPTLIIKGEIEGNIVLYTSTFDRFELAGTYAIFLYGSNEVSFCSLVLPFGSSISSRQELEQYINRKDIDGALTYKPLFDYAKP